MRRKQMYSAWWPGSLVYVHDARLQASMFPGLPQRETAHQWSCKPCGSWKQGRAHRRSQRSDQKPQPGKKSSTENCSSKRTSGTWLTKKIPPSCSKNKMPHTHKQICRGHKSPLWVHYGNSRFHRPSENLAFARFYHGLGDRQGWKILIQAETISQREIFLKYSKRVWNNWKYSWNNWNYGQIFYLEAKKQANIIVEKP